MSTERYSDSGLAKVPPDPFRALNDRQFDENGYMSPETEAAYRNRANKLGNTKGDTARFKSEAAARTRQEKLDKGYSDKPAPQPRAQAPQRSDPMRTVRKLNSLARIARGTKGRRR